MIRKILVYTYGNRSHEATIKAAARFATQHGAELTGVFVRPDFMGYATMYGDYPLNLAQSFYNLQSDLAKKSKAEFEQLTVSYDIRCQWYEMEENERKPNPAFYSDYIFVSQPNSESGVIFNDTDFVDHLITDTGLATIIVPENWSADNFADHPALGWKETREAAGAIRHSLPLMRAAQKVDIVTIGKGDDLDEELIEGIEISDYLTEHQVTTKFFTEQVTSTDSDEPRALLRHVENHGCDLIIIGGYGHSRLREIILGGMTRHLIRNSPIPLLLSH